MRFLRLFDCWSLGIDVSLYRCIVTRRGIFWIKLGAFSFIFAVVESLDFAN